MVWLVLCWMDDDIFMRKKMLLCYVTTKESTQHAAHLLDYTMHRKDQIQYIRTNTYMMENTYGTICPACTRMWLLIWLGWRAIHSCTLVASRSNWWWKTCDSTALLFGHVVLLHHDCLTCWRWWRWKPIDVLEFEFEGVEVLIVVCTIKGSNVY